MVTLILSQTIIQVISRTINKGSDYFSTKVCDLALHFGAKSSCPSYTQILQTHPIKDGGRYWISNSSIIVLLARPSRGESVWCYDTHPEQGVLINSCCFDN